MARVQTATDIINQVAVEVGLQRTVDPVTSLEDTYIQLTGLLNAAGQELVEMNAWQLLRRQYSFTTTADTEEYPLPDDFAYMIDQTGWNQSGVYPMTGPLSAQVWAQVSSQAVQPVYAGFRLLEGYMTIQPAAAGMTINFEYVSRNWVLEAGLEVRKDLVNTGSDIVLYEPILIRKFLKVKWLDAKGFPSDAARLDFDNIFSGRVGKDVGAPILNAAGSRRHHLIGIGNIPESGYG